MIRCRICGKENLDEADTCVFCTNPLKASSATESKPASTYNPSFSNPPLAAPLMPSGIGFRCPYCQSTYTPAFYAQTSTAGWIVVLILLLVCFPLFWLGFFIQETHAVCRSCGMRLN